MELNWDKIKFEPYNPGDKYEVFSDFHAVNTIVMGELIRDGLIDFSDGTWINQVNGQPIKWYSDEQRKRFWGKFQDYYYWREIGEIPYKRWKMNLLAKIGLLMPKYYMLYELLDRGVDPLQVYDDYGKSRNIYSDFPQTMLSGNEDYASTGNDNQYERIRQGDFVEKMNAVMDNYNDPDFALVRELDSHFYCLLSSNLNGF